MALLDGIGWYGTVLDNTGWYWLTRNPSKPSRVVVAVAWQVFLLFLTPWLIFGVLNKQKTLENFEKHKIGWYWMLLDGIVYLRLIINNRIMN